MSMRLGPNRSASSDHAPGPAIASPAPRPPRTRCNCGDVGPASTIESSAIVSSAPAMGVHQPTMREAPATSASHCRRTGSELAAPVAASRIGGIPAATRSSSRPVPGQPRGKVENKRRRKSPGGAYGIRDCGQTPGLGPRPPLFRGVLFCHPERSEGSALPLFIRADPSSLRSSG